MIMVAVRKYHSAKNSYYGNTNFISYARDSSKDEQIGKYVAIV
ncbi:hypothetical protein M2475_001970 [Breznakia sp. PF5-3]|nr:MULTISPECIES: hypothetical protein [unclassified Breznakia]MDF9825523.1 hypothetical protein [Breznakia sp. PM6-1]MDF9836390.1 hypothetical protein [Breznakia sp. PF5-3]MDF9838734.1 hypothetical protein [Breznakia sp. PFB2-8]MDF9860542.1 hypothetical protein [Breznakia sp. PH5-24]